MLVKSPSKPKKTRPNRKKPSPKQKKATPKSRKSKSSTGFGKRVSKNKKRFTLPNIQPWKIILGIIIAGALGMLYLKHVFATQQLLGEVQQLEQTYQQTKRQHDRYRLTYDRLIGPKVIYDKAKAMGFIDGGPAEKVIEVKPE